MKKTYYHPAAKQAPYVNVPKKPVENLTFQQTQAVVRDCRARFWSEIVIPLLLAEAEFYKVWDMCEERNIIRFKNKTWLNETQKCFTKFREWLSKCEGNTSVLMDDYAVQMSKRLSREMKSLYVTFYSYFEKEGLTDLPLKAQTQLTISLISMTFDLFDSYFNLYNERFGVDLRKDYLPARIAEASANFGMFAKTLIQPKGKLVKPCSNYSSIKAYEEFCDKLFDEKTLDKAGIKALELNHEDEFLSQLERQKMGLDKLAEKYAKPK
jgi:hypothetical protein